MEEKAIQKFENQGVAIIEAARAIQITDEASREAASTFSVEARKVVKNIEAEFKPDIEKAYQLHKNLLARMKRLSVPFLEARKIVDDEIRRDYLERERQRRIEEEAERKRQEEARRKQEAEQTRLAEELIDEGDMDGAEAVLNSDVVVSPIKPVEEVTKSVKTTSGTSTVRKDISVTLVNTNQALRAVVDGRMPELLVKFDMGAVKRYAKANGLTSMPGFRIEETVVVSGRTS